jgi:Family of unknown function (DUF6526)
MPEKMPQTLENHTKLHPPFHFFLLPVVAVNICVSVWNAIKNPGFDSAWLVVMALALAVAVFLIRIYALKVQDRVIRLEERLRLNGLLPEPLRARIPQLDEKQMVALRFAADAEIPALVERALDQKLPPADIKKAIRTWRPDYYRV